MFALVLAPCGFATSAWRWDMSVFNGLHTAPKNEHGCFSREFEVTAIRVQ